MEEQPRPDERSGADSGAPTPAPTRAADGAVDAPAHYLGGKMECIDAIDALVSQLKDVTSGFYAGQVIKYLWRHERKGRALEDLKKARWYLDRLISLKESRD